MNGSAEFIGGCNCGAIRYRIEGRPITVAACHCGQCRRQSGAAFSINLVVRTATMKVEGELASWTDTATESGAPLKREFCGRCGSPVRSVPSASPNIAAVKAGTLDDPELLAPALHIWTSRKLAWVSIPEGLPQFPKGPPS